MIKRGTVVRLRGCKSQAIVIARLKDIKGGVFLDRMLRGFRYWNIEDLERVPVNEQKKLR
jgi:hypothetical protein